MIQVSATYLFSSYLFKCYGLLLWQCSSSTRQWRESDISFWVLAVQAEVAVIVNDGTTSLGEINNTGISVGVDISSGGLSISTSNTGTAGASGGVSLATGSVDLGGDSGDLSTQQPV